MTALAASLAFPSGTWRLAPPAAHAQAGATMGARIPPGASVPIALTGLRSWSAPTNTRLVFDFSASVVPVAPDSGATGQLIVSVPGVPVSVPDSVRTKLVVGDGVVDSVLALADADGARLIVWLADTTRFRVFTLEPETDKPFRLVVDVVKRGAADAEAERLARIAERKRAERLRIVVIDAGHGGEDFGARSARGTRALHEKSVTLAIARALADEINRIPGLKAHLTRDGDYFIPLRDRYRKAEQVRADVFISIHCNSSRRRGAGRGTEVFFLSLKGASDQADADLADLENAADLVGGVPEQAEDDVVNILYDVKRSSAMQQSQLLAETLLDHVTEDRRLGVRGVKQAGFVVLKSVEFPSVLVETAFINNPTEARLLGNAQFQRAMARQLAAGVRAYFQRAGITLGGGGAASPDPGAETRGAAESASGGSRP
jgi:N-acetylmuramoyl-L-alanine amidase